MEHYIELALSPVLVPGLPNCTTLYTVLRNGIRTGRDGTRRTCSLGRPWNAAESSRRQTCKLSLTLGESTTRDGPRLESRTPQAALRRCTAITFAPQHFCARLAQSLPTKVRRAKRWNNANRVPITMSGFTKEQYIGVMQMLDLDARPQEGMIFRCAGQASGGWRVFDIWDLQGAFDQFLRQAARLNR